MARVGTKAAREVLAGVMNNFGVTLSELRSKSRTEDVALAKQAFLDRCGELKIPIIVMAATIGVSRYTIYFRSHPEKRTARMLHERRRRAAKSEVSAAAIAGWW
jgi:hypothetical protein